MESVIFFDNYDLYSNIDITKNDYFILVAPYILHFSIEVNNLK